MQTPSKQTDAFAGQAIHERATMPAVLLHRGAEVHRGTYNECCVYLIRNQCDFVRRALRSGDWSILPA